MLLKIDSRLVSDRRIILQMAYSQIATLAQPTSELTGGVIVVETHPSRRNQVQGVAATFTEFGNRATSTLLKPIAITLLIVRQLFIGA